MTDKHTREEKIILLLELLEPTTSVHYKHFDWAMADSWLNAAEEHDTREQFVAQYAYSNADNNYMTLVRTSWDVRSGAAFTKLYKALR